MEWNSDNNLFQVINNICLESLLIQFSVERKIFGILLGFFRASHLVYSDKYYDKQIDQFKHFIAFAFYFLNTYFLHNGISNCRTLAEEGRNMPKIVEMIPRTFS